MIAELTKREYFASIAMGHLLSHPDVDLTGDIARAAVGYADALIEALGSQSQIDASAFAPAPTCKDCGSEVSASGKCSCLDQPASALVEGLASMASRKLGEKPSEEWEQANPGRRAGQTVEAFEASQSATKPLVTATCNKCRAEVPGDDPFFDGLCDDCLGEVSIMPTMRGIAEIAGNEEPEGGRPLNWIPDESEIRTGSEMFGTRIEFPAEEWNHEPLTEEGGESGGGQLKAVNTALSVKGYGGKERHRIAQILLDAYGPIYGRTPTQVTSAHDLTKAEAHILISYFEKALPDSLNALYKAAGKEIPCLV